MSSTLKRLAVQIVRFVDDSFPGWVECKFTDSEGRLHTFVDKWPIVTTEVLDENSAYPRSGYIHCEVLSRLLDTRGRELVRITTAFSTESTEGLSEFVVLSSQLSD